MLRNLRKAETGLRPGPVVVPPLTRPQHWPTDPKIERAGQMETNDPKVELARAKLEAAKLRTRATHQQTQAESYRRQATKPIYDGQAEICQGKAAECDSLAVENRARADLIEAEAGAEYRAAGQEPPAKQ